MFEFQIACRINLDMWHFHFRPSFRIYLKCGIQVVQLKHFPIWHYFEIPMSKLSTNVGVYFVLQMLICKRKYAEDATYILYIKHRAKVRFQLLICTFQIFRT